MALRILHLVGSAESAMLDDLSRLYAADCLRTTEDPDRYEPVVAHVAPGGSWRFPTALSDEALGAEAPVSLAAALSRITALGIDAMVPQMFCLPGMTHYRAIFDMLGIPYLGNPPAVMALGAHKARAKAVVAAAGVAVPAGEVVRLGEPCTVPLPAVVKPVDGDNSIGVTLVRDPRELTTAIAEACAHGEAALVERYVELGREVRCGVLEQRGELVTLPLEEYAVDTTTKPIRDPADKLRRGAGDELELVAKDRTRAWIVDPEDPACAPVWDAAKSCHAALGCRHYSLFDFRLDPAGRPWFLEAGLYCSFAEQSVVSTMASAIGITTAELFANVLADALAGSSRPGGGAPRAPARVA
jgi:D-alanine-D-alanine ligase